MSSNKWMQPTKLSPILKLRIFFRSTFLLFLNRVRASSDLFYDCCSVWFWLLTGFTDDREVSIIDKYFRAWIHHSNSFLIAHVEAFKPVFPSGRSYMVEKGLIKHITHRSKKGRTEEKRKRFATHLKVVEMEKLTKGPGWCWGLNSY